MKLNVFTINVGSTWMKKVCTKEEKLKVGLNSQKATVGGRLTVYTKKKTRTLSSIEHAICAK